SSDLIGLDALLVDPAASRDGAALNALFLDHGADPDLVGFDALFIDIAAGRDRAVHNALFIDVAARLDRDLLNHGLGDVGGFEDGALERARDEDAAGDGPRRTLDGHGFEAFGLVEEPAEAAATAVPNPALHDRAGNDLHLGLVVPAFLDDRSRSRDR